MPEFVTIIYLVFMFLALYFFFLFIMLIMRNKNRIFDYPKPNRIYSLSILVPAYNEEDTIKETIEHIMASSYKGIIEVIAINDGSKDKTAEIVRNLQKKYRKLRLLDKKNSGKADSLNQAIKIAKGELIAIVDADSYPDKESVEKLVGYFNDKTVAAATSTVFIRNKVNFLTKIQVVEYIIMAWTRKLLDFVNAVYVTTGPLSIYRTDAVKKVGGFDVNTVTEDIDLTWHLMNEGYNTRMCLSAFVTTTVPTKFKVWWRQRERWGIGGIQAIFKYKKAFFRKGIFGIFVIPFVSLSIILSMAIFMFGIYLFLKALLVTYLSTKYSYLANTYLFSLQDINLHPSILIFFTVILFTIAFLFSRYILDTLGREKGEPPTIRNLFNRLFYMLVYLTLYPIIWFSSIYRMIKGDYKW
mgnify:CR=1 FL=1